MSSVKERRDDRMSEWAKRAMAEHERRMRLIDSGRFAYPEEHHEAFRAGVEAGKHEFTCYSFIRAAWALEELVGALHADGYTSPALAEADKALAYYDEAQGSRFIEMGSSRDRKDRRKAGGE